MTTVYGDLVRYRELFGNLFRRDLQAKYRGSVLGVAWTLANPILLMAVYLLVFSVLWKTGVRLRALRALPARRARRPGSSSRRRCNLPRARCSTTRT